MMKSNIHIFAISTFAALSLSTSAGALSITPTSDATGLANTLFLNTDLFIQNVRLLGEFGQAGTFTNQSGTYGLPPTGIVLSTGLVQDYADGPNTEEGRTTAFAEDFGEFESDVAAELVGFDLESSGLGIPSQEQNDLLSPISGQNIHFDPVQLDIQFLANDITDRVTFFATFGSEEFPEFQNSGVNDAFGIYVNGVNQASVFGQPVNIDNPNFLAVDGTELDGVLAPGGNTVLRFDLAVNAGALNNFTLILADAGDAILDTTVYLSSFFANPNEVTVGETQFNPLLPVNEPLADGTFVIPIPVDDFDEGQTIWIDPPIAVGYSYEIDSTSGAEFASVTAPSLATIADIDGYTITANGITQAIIAGQTLDFAALFGDTVTSFLLEGIDIGLDLDPADPLAFPLGVSLTNLIGVTSVLQTPLTFDPDPTTPSPVPLPAGSLMYLSVLGLGAAHGISRRRRNKKVNG